MSLVMPQLVCFACGAANRLPDDRDPGAGRCGRCKTDLFTGVPADVTGQGLERHKRLTQGVALLLDVWAPWCGPCRAMAPSFAAAAPRLEPAARLIKLNSEAEPAAASALGVSGIPALLLFKDGAVAARTTGAMSAEQIVGWTRQALGSAR
jgi:thioredoxin 2